jgi:hypothetical protein
VHYRIEQCYRHGIDTPHWHDYLMVEKETGFPGDLFILQEKPDHYAPSDPILLAQSFRHLSNTIAQIVPGGAPGHDHARRGMVYWRIESFEVVKSIDFERPEEFSAKEKWRMWRNAEILQSAVPPTATRPSPQTHLCPICGQFGAFGFHPPLPPPHGWFCREHQPMEHEPR